MKIIKAKVEDSEEISARMISELYKYSEWFPKKMIENFRKHARKENIVKEFEKPNLIAFVAKDDEKIIGFIVGYEDQSNKSSMIHYITADDSETKQKLLKKFIEECKIKKIKKIITDTFEFMENNEFFRSNKFLFVKNEKISSDLNMIWYEFDLN